MHVKIGSVGGASRQMMKEDHEMAASCIFSKREGGVDEASISGAHSSRLAVNAWMLVFSFACWSKVLPASL